MSEMEAHTGRLVEIEMFDDSCIECYLEHIYTKEKGITDKNFWETWADYAVYEAGEYFIYNNTLYKIKEHIRVHRDNYMNEEPDGSLRFAFQFYNGGGSFQDEIKHLFCMMENDDGE